MVVVAVVGYLLNVCGARRRLALPRDCVPTHVELFSLLLPFASVFGQAGLLFSWVSVSVSPVMVKSIPSDPK